MKKKCFVRIYYCIDDQLNFLALNVTKNSKMKRNPVVLLVLDDSRHSERHLRSCLERLKKEKKTHFNVLFIKI